MKKSKEYITVALNGDGGDENFAGYPRYKYIYLIDILRRLPLRVLFGKWSDLLYRIFKKRKLSIMSKMLNKIQLHISRKLKYSSGLGYPDNIQIEPTNYCNARCPLCPTGAYQLKRPKGYMDIFLFKKIIDEVSGKTIHITLWNYGEPTLHPKIFDMIEYTKKKGLGISVSTNGYVFYKESNIRKLVLSNMDTLIVSLDGASEKVFSYYRKNVDFNKVKEGLLKLKNLKKKMHRITPNVEIQFILMKHNLQELEKIKELAKKLGDNLRLKTVNVEMVKGIKMFDWVPENHQFSRYKTDVKGKYTLKKQNNYNCPLIWKSLVVNWDGSVNPCCYDYQGEVVVGDASIQPIHEIWTGERMQNFRKSILKDRRENEICRNCPVDLYEDKLIILEKS